ncbi:cadherin-like protein 26 [Triplophysa dalaica]|uniref:cadherin-like protein 26 n=1 Tax=Triplophysa dalaica TaxID=1582913 RepID=UPI0024DFDF6F|nr:cadherin-like protein 26 [Triplophysa dalaica]
MRTLPVTFLLLLFALTTYTWADTGRIRQKRAWIIDSFSIEEENPGPFPYKLGNIELDRKYLVNFALYGEGVTEEPKGVLSINDQTGEICVHKKVDYESIADSSKALKLHFEAVNRSNNEVDTRLGVEIKVLDINDNPPIFQQSNYDVTLEESHAQGDKILTVLASDKDDITTLNGTFSFAIKSVIPKTDNVEFYIKQSDRVATIYFKGCLDYEKSPKYTILLEAKDHGEKKQLSSTSTVTVKISDNNNHIPEFTGQTGSGKVKERDIGTEVLRFQVTDKDTRGTNAWKAKYIIHGDTKHIFKIETDPTTNEGILTVVKAMDYEEQAYQNVSISVQNEAPYFSCTIKNRPDNSMWEVNRFFETPKSNPKLYKFIPVTIYVEDVNDPPVFTPPVTDVNIRENTDVGTFVTTVTAVDSDGAHGNTIRYVKGQDDSNWITVDERTGKISVAKLMDRESLENSTYTAIVFAVDNGEPPLTGTSTVRIHLQDLNDNVPLLTVNHVNLCLDKEPTRVNITAVDLDLPPYSSPFYYELLGDVKGKWRIDPAQGTTVDLVKESNVYSGHHFLQIRIADQQGFSTMQNLSVTVCNCARDSSCHERMVSKARMGSGGTWALILAVLLLAVILLMAFLMTCKAPKNMIPLDNGFGRLITTNTEIPGTDCMVPFNGNDETHSHRETKVPTIIINGVQDVAQVPNSISSDHLIQTSLYGSYTRHLSRDIINYQRSSIRSSTSYSRITIMRQKLFSLINQRLLVLQTCDEDRDAYKPHCYAHEGEFIANADLDTISIAETDFLPESLNYLDYKFSKLATICSPPPMKT